MKERWAIKFGSRVLNQERKYDSYNGTKRLIVTVLGSMMKCDEGGVEEDGFVGACRGS